MFLAGRATEWRRVKRGLGMTGLLLGLGVPGLSAEAPPKPFARVPLGQLGFPGYPVSLLHAGASMATVHALDGKHVLFTYSLRSLVPRLPGDDANDTDRQVEAVLLEVPSGKVLARAKWYLHDHGRYLWSVGRGVFVLRMGSELSVIAPLQGLAAGTDAFRRYALPHRPGTPVLVNGSPDGKVVTVELESELPRAAGDDESGERRRKHYTLEFYRLKNGDRPETPIAISGAGAVGSPLLLRLAMDGDGYLWAEDGNKGKWTVSFNEFGGKEQQIAPVLSSCNPRLNLLSRSQFLVETCRGSDQQPVLAAFGFDGHENWEEPFGEALQPPTLAVAPEAGRFAMSRLVASSNGAPVSSLGNDDPLSQEVRVYQTESGDMLLKVQCSPAVRTAENFDLSPDGKTLAVLAPETVDLYRLPELSARDRKDLAEVQAITPPVGDGPVALAHITRPIDAPGSVGGGDAVRSADEEPAAVAAGPDTSANPGADGGAGSTPAAAKPAAVEAGKTAAVAGDEHAGDERSSAGSRKPPTLMKPGETPEFKGQKGSPN